MTTRVHYGPGGVLGILTPQANTTVEPEFGILLPPGVAALTARLTSDKPTVDARLADYVLSMEATLDRFANAPLGAVAFACTGASYLVDPEEERAHLAAIAARRGYPVLTAANAIMDALGVLGAERVAIVSPYGDPLHGQALDYWRARGLEAVRVARIDSDDSAFHPIYALSAEAPGGLVDKMDMEGLDAVVMLGTGLPTLPAILRRGGRPVPLLSPNLCLVWRSLVALDGGRPTGESLAPWLTGAAWGDRFRARVRG